MSYDKAREFDGVPVFDEGFLYEPHTQFEAREKEEAARKEIEQFLKDICEEAKRVKAKKQEERNRDAQFERSPRPKDQREVWDKIQELERRIDELERRPTYTPWTYPVVPPQYPPMSPRNPWDTWVTWCDTETGRHKGISDTTATARPWYGNASNIGHEVKP